jgi:DNA sulfur modification protein DndD
MIKLKSASFKNFRALIDLDLEFSTDEKAPVTVIKGTNATGKTTIHRALMWCLFGDVAFKRTGGRRNFRLSPLGLRDGVVTNISVECVIEKSNDEGSFDKYRLIRSSIETISGNGFECEPTQVKVYKMNQSGDKPITNPQVFIEEQLFPPTKMNIFFVHGEEMHHSILLNNDNSVRRQNIKDVVDSLLDIKIIESSLARVKISNKSIDRNQKGTISVNIIDIKNQINKLEEKIDDLENIYNEKKEKEKFTSVVIDDLQKIRDNAMKAGGSKLKEIHEAQLSEETNKKKIEQQIKAEKQYVSSLLNSTNIVFELAGMEIYESLFLLEELSKKGDIPNVRPELLSSILLNKICYCGCEITENSEQYFYIEKQIKDLANFNKYSEILSAILDNLKISHSNFKNNIAFESLRKACKNINDKNDEIVSVNKKISELIRTTNEVKEAGSVFEKADKEYNEKMRAFDAEKEINRKFFYDIEQERQKKTILDRKYDEALRQDKASKSILHQQEIATDILSVMSATVSSLKNETLLNVSNEMNNIFLNMMNMGAEESSEERAVSKVMLDHTNFDIYAFGPKGEELKINTDLSGYQQRALTMSMMFSLIKVCGTTYPIIIDTPIGNGSDSTRVAFIKTFLNESGQSILLMTRDEMHGIESELFGKAGKQYTISNSQNSIDKNLFNEVFASSVIICKCDYSSNCIKCSPKEVV